MKEKEQIYALRMSWLISMSVMSVWSFETKINVAWLDKLLMGHEPQAAVSFAI